jgi:outer membrane autotransporter barrel domain
VVYTILTANGGVNGIFSSSTITPPINHYNIFYTPNNVYFTTNRNAVRVQEGPLTGNPLIVQHYLEYVDMEPFSDLYNIMRILCCDISYNEYIEALNELHPALFSTTPELKYNNQYDGMNLFSQRLRTAYTGNQLLARQDRTSTKRFKDKLTAWIQPMGYVKHKKTVNYDRGYGAQEAGFMAGTDYRFGKHLLLGVGAGYTRDHSKWHYPLAPIDRTPDTVIHSGFFGCYGELYGKYWYLNASALGSHNNYIYRRRINFATINRTAYSTHHGLAWSAHAEGGIHYPFTTYKIYVEPMVWLDELKAYEKGFTETGADSLNMIVDGKDTSMRQVCAGVRVFKDFIWSRCMLEPKITLGYLYDKPLNNRTYTARYVDQTNILTVYGTDLRHSYALVGADLRMGFKQDRSFFAGIHYEAHIRGDYHSHHASCMVEKTF